MSTAQVGDNEATAFAFPGEFAWPGVEGWRLLPLTSILAERIFDLSRSIQKGTPVDDWLETNAASSDSLAALRVVKLDGLGGDDILIDRSGYGAALSVTGRHDLDGGTGADQMILDIWLVPGAAIGRIDDRSTMTGGRGADEMRYSAELGSFANEDTRVRGPIKLDLRMDGGAGNDLIVASQNLFDGPGHGGRITNRINAGDGDDFVNMTVYGSVEFDQAMAPSIRSEVSGGNGNDNIGASLYGVGGWLKLDGGKGNDQLTTVGGTAFLNGGTGNDTLIGVQGDATCVGGSGADTFVIDPHAPDYFDTGKPFSVRIDDFKRAEDTLWVSYEFPFGDASMEDLLDTTSVMDGGPGGDVTVSFDSGFELVFEGVGTSYSDRITDIADNFIFT